MDGKNRKSSWDGLDTGPVLKRTHDSAKVQLDLNVFQVSPGLTWRKDKQKDNFGRVQEALRQQKLSKHKRVQRRFIDKKGLHSDGASELNNTWVPLSKSQKTISNETPGTLISRVPSILSGPIFESFE